MKRADRLLKYFAMSSKHIGELVHCLNGTPTVERAFAWSESLNGEEVRFLVNLLTEEGWIVHQLHSGGFDVRVLAGGYIHLDNVAAQFSASVQGFVAMWFDDSMSSVYLEGMSPGIEDAGYSPMRIDRKHHNNKIDDEIIAEIRRSRFLVADFTHGDAGARGGVYYEAGFAHGLSIPVIFTIRADMLTHAHFDTRQYSHILWKDATDLRKQLADRISATIGDGPMKPEPS
jgi:hypothetical protein